MSPIAIDPPEINNPIAIKIMLSGNSVLGPSKKFDIPNINNPIDIRVIRFMYFEMIGTIIAIMPKLTDVIQKNNPCKLTDVVKSSSLNESTGST